MQIRERYKILIWRIRVFIGEAYSAKNLKIKIIVKSKMILTFLMQIIESLDDPNFKIYSAMKPC